MHQVINFFKRSKYKGSHCTATGTTAGAEHPNPLPGKGLPSLRTPQLLLKQLLLARNSLLISRRVFSTPSAGHLQQFFPPRLSSLLPCPTGPRVAFCANRLLDNLLIQRSNFWMTLSSTIKSHAQFGRHFYHQCL